MEAEAAIQRGTVASDDTLVIDDATAVEITEGDLNGPMEEESMILNLTQNMPKTAREKVSSPGVRTSVHGSTPATNPNIKTVARTSQN